MTGDRDVYERRDVESKWRAVVGSVVGIVMATAAHGCSSTKDDPNACPTSGTYLMHVTVNGPWIMAPRVVEPLIESAEGACASNTPATNCSPTTLDVTMTLGGQQVNDGVMSQLQPVRWSTGSGESGTCSFVSSATLGGQIDTGSDPPTVTHDTQCELAAVDCEGGTIDSLGLTFDVGGTYGHAIAAGVSMDGCCWQGAATKQ